MIVGDASLLVSASLCQQMKPETYEVVWRIHALSMRETTSWLALNNSSVLYDLCRGRFCTQAGGCCYGATFIEVVFSAFV
jgi:hypothetical protein